MAIVMIILALGLGFCAYKAEPGTVRVALIGFCLLNVIGAAATIIERDPYAFRLKPNYGEQHDNYRRP